MRSFAPLSLVLVGAVLAACGSSDSTTSDAAAGSGGASGTHAGGAAGTKGGAAGANHAGTGQAAGTAGHAAGASGTGAGGKAAGGSGSGGKGTGGGAPKGGSSSTGGSTQMTGGAPDTGGSSSTGGSPDTGGSTANGGSPDTGGSPGSGGASTATGPLMTDFIGINGFINDPNEILDSVGTIREYHDWTWNAGDDGKSAGDNEFQSVYGIWNFDDYYEHFHGLGITVIPCIQGSLSSINGDLGKPAQGDKNTTDPASYKAHAQFMYQYAARYGSTTVDDGSLSLHSNQPRVSGLGYLQYLENFNEEENIYVSDSKSVFTAEEMAAMSSADYDGNKGAMGAGVGIKTADPNMKLVLGGLSGDKNGNFVQNITGYLDGIKAWSATNRGGSFPADVLAIHYYCFGGDGKTRAQSPEDCDEAGIANQVVQYRDANLPGMPLWLGEFGFDTNQQSVLHAPPVASYSAEQVQAQWIIRGFLALLKGGVDRAQLYIASDGSETDSTQFASAGLALVEKGSQHNDLGIVTTTKPSLYYVKTFTKRLGAMRYAGENTSGSDNVRIAHFIGAGGAEAYAVWSPTMAGTTTSGFALDLGGSATAATAVALADQADNGNETTLSVSGTSVSVDVSENPVLVMVQRLST